MATKLEELQDAAREQTKRAREVAEKAAAENRPLSEDERRVYDEAMAKGRELVEKIKTERKDAQVLADAKALAEEIGESAAEDVAELGKSGGADVRRRIKNLGVEVVRSDQFKSALASALGQGRTRVSEKQRFDSGAIPVKSLFVGGSATSAGAFVVPEQSGIVEMLGRKPLTIRDLVSVRRTNSDAVEFVRQTSHTNNAAPVAEATSSAAPTAPEGAGALVRDPDGGYKPEGAWAFERDTAVVKTIAEWVPATKRALADVDALEDLINQELAADVAEAEEEQIIAGDGTGENLTGILNTSGTQAQAFDTDIFRTARKALTKARVVGRVNPTAFVFNPEDEETIDLAQDANDRYYGAGPFGTGPNTLWGVPRTSSESVPAGTFILADWTKAVLWDRQETTVTVTDSHEDFFVRNLVAILAEERVAFAAVRPSAFVIGETAAA